MAMRRAAAAAATSQRLARAPHLLPKGRSSSFFSSFSSSPLSHLSSPAAACSAALPCSSGQGQGPFSQHQVPSSSHQGPFSLHQMTTLSGQGLFTQPRAHSSFSSLCSGKLARASQHVRGVHAQRGPLLMEQHNSPLGRASTEGSLDEKEQGQAELAEQYGRAHRSEADVASPEAASATSGPNGPNGPGEGAGEAARPADPERLAQKADSSGHAGLSPGDARAHAALEEVEGSLEGKQKTQDRGFHLPQSGAGPGPGPGPGPSGGK